MTVQRFGLSKEHYGLIDELLFIPLREAGCDVAVFGSRARGDHREFSDLDVLVEGEVEAAVLARIRTELEESLLPIRVDIIPARELADTYRDSVQRELVRVWKR